MKIEEAGMKKVFLVEDDKTISKNLMLLLKSEGFAACTFA